MKDILITIGQLLFSLFMYSIGTLFFALALIPGIALVLKTWSITLDMNSLLRFFVLGISLSGAYFLFGFSLIILIGLTRIIFRLKLKEGDYPIFSLGALNWALCGGLQLMITFTFLDFILLTPFANLLLRLQGAKIGKNVQINSKTIADASLLEIGDNTVIGGSATVICHAVERGKLKLRKVKIGKNVTVGLNAVILPGCEIGDHAVIGASAVLLKNTKVEPGSVYFGVPAEQVKPHHHKEGINNA
ncbi:MAG: DapH/DapD/GlmU-related protein [Candidatus Omnitrophota bacterium]